MTPSSEAYDEKNQQDYDDNTDKINVGLEKISSNVNLKPTISQLSEITGLHRNTLRERGFPKERLAEIKKERKVRALLKKEEKKDQIATLDEKLENAKAELIYWFTKCQKLEQDLHQLKIKEKRIHESKDYYYEERNRERDKVKELQKELDRLNELMHELSKAQNS